jgi:hypothetical protein
VPGAGDTFLEAQDDCALGRVTEFVSSGLWEPQKPSFSPDGLSIAVPERRYGRVVRINASTGEISHLAGPSPNWRQARNNEDGQVGMVDGEHTALAEHFCFGYWPSFVFIVGWCVHGFSSVKRTTPRCKGQSAGLALPQIGARYLLTPFWRIY